MPKIKIACEGATTASIDDLVPFQGKLKVLTDEAYRKFKSIIEELGFSEPISIWKNQAELNILNGHQRLETLKRMKADGWQVPPIPINLVHAKSIHEAKKKVLALTSQYGDISKDGLHEFMMDAGLQFDDLSNFKFETDFTMDEFRADFDLPGLDGSGSSQGLTADDEIPEVEKNIHNVKLGQIWQLGRHRLMCGDSSKVKDRSKLLSGNKVDLVLTDPPYGVGYAYNSHDDNIDAKSHETFSKNLIQSALKLSDRFIITPGCNNLALYNKLSDPNHIGCWTKTNAMSPGRVTYFWTWEPIFFYGKFARKRGNDVFNFPVGKQPDTGDHTCPKPIKLWADLVINFSETNNLIFDFFLGSGTTLIACDKADRICYGLEIDPHYCSIIIERWQNVTGQKAELIEEPANA